MKSDVTINIPDECVVPAIEDALGNKPTPAFENPVGILGDIGVYLRYAFPDGTLVFSDGKVLKVTPATAAEIRKAWVLRRHPLPPPASAGKRGDRRHGISG